jgi:hypothetical protein
MYFHHNDELVARPRRPSSLIAADAQPPATPGAQTSSPGQSNPHGGVVGDIFHDRGGPRRSGYPSGIILNRRVVVVVVMAVRYVGHLDTPAAC